MKKKLQLVIHFFRVASKKGVTFLIKALKKGILRILYDYLLFLPVFYQMANLLTINWSRKKNSRIVIFSHPGKQMRILSKAIQDNSCCCKEKTQVLKPLFTNDGYKCLRILGNTIKIPHITLCNALKPTQKSRVFEILICSTSELRSFQRQNRIFSFISVTRRSIRKKKNVWIFAPKICHHCYHSY